MHSGPVVVGALYWVDDRLLTLPPNEDRGYHPRRPVLVVSGSETNSDRTWPFVLAIPTSTEPRRVTRFCVKLSAAESGMGKKTWVRVGAVQPLMKDVLQDRAAIVAGAKLNEVRARLMQYLGLADDEL